MTATRCWTNGSVYAASSGTDQRTLVNPHQFDGMDLSGLPEDWTVWNETDDKLILAYRPDIFDSEQFPAPCLPTIYLTRGKRTRRPGADRTGENWYVTFYLEPDVERDAESYERRDAAVEGAVELATRFADGDLDYRSLYQVPREAYLDKLDALTGRS